MRSEGGDLPEDDLHEGLAFLEEELIEDALPLLESALHLPRRTLERRGVSLHWLVERVDAIRLDLGMTPHTDEMREVLEADRERLRRAEQSRPERTTAARKRKADKEHATAGRKRKAGEERPAARSKETDEVTGRTGAQAGLRAGAQETDAAPAPLEPIQTVEVGEGRALILGMTGAGSGAGGGASGTTTWGLDHYLLVLQARELTQAARFEQLLCLPGLQGVRQFEFQTESVRKVLQRFRGRVLLADEVGLGKTIEAGMVVREYWMRGMAQKILVLTPPALVSQWCEELSTKFGLSPQAAEGAVLRRDPEAFWRSADLVVASLALARNKRHRPILGSLRFDLVVVDEAHHLKNRRTAGWKLVNELRSRFLLLLTATPVQNDLLDLYSLVTLLKPGQLGTQAAYRRSFMLSGAPTRPRNRDQLRELLGEVMIRNTRATADVRLPPRHATTLLVEGTPAEQELYRQLTELVRACYRQDVSRLALGLLLQEAGSSPSAVRQTLQKMASHEGLDASIRLEMERLARMCGYVPEPAKVSHLLDLLRASGEKTLVFSRFRATLHELAGRLEEADIPHSVFTGELSRQDKDAAVERFRNGVDVMLCSEVGGEGRNLQFCSTLVNFDLPWNPMRIEQRIGRIHRIGQQRPVYVYNLCARSTAEHHILEVLDQRINLFELVVGELDLVLGQRKDEAEFEERILSIYGESRSEQEVEAAFDRLGDELLQARRRYDQIKQLDGEIFADDYEV